MDLNNISIAELKDYLLKCKEDYYNGTPTISDEQFDYYERKLKQMDPTNDYFNKIGAKTLTGEIKITHKIPMLSMQKEQTFEKVDDWFGNILNKFPNLNFNGQQPYLVVDPKLDGISGNIVFDKDGNLKYAATRGDGYEGSIIPFADKLKCVPKHFLGNCELRGEFIIKKIHRDKFKGPLRNNVSGLLKRLEYSPQCDLIDFVVYNCNPYDQDFEWLDRVDLMTTIKNYILDYASSTDYVEPFITTNIQETYDEYVHNLRDFWDWETDGIIFTIGGPESNYKMIDSAYKITSCHRYNMALKPPALCAESKVIDIQGYTNRIKVSFVATIEPVQLMDIVCTHATLDNYSLMKEKKIGIGSTVLVKRANDVIPKITESFNKPEDNVKFIEFTHCPSCGTKLIRVYRDLACPNEYGCEGIVASKIIKMLKSIGVKSIGPAVAKKIAHILVEVDKDSSWTHFFDRLKTDRFINELWTPGSKSAENYSKAIDFIFNNITEMQLLDGFNIPYTGAKELINHGIKSISDLLKYYEKIKNSKNVNLSSFDSIIFNWLNDCKHLQDIVHTNEILANYFVHDSSDSGKQTYCISGEIPGFKHKSDLIKLLKEKRPDLVFVDSVTTETNYLISVETSTSKVLKAKRYNIPIVKIDELINQ